MASLKILSLTLLLASISMSQGREEDDKKCDPTWEYKCGDVCVSGSCSCGNVTLTKYSPFYCCTKPGDKCKGGGWSGICSSGTPVPRSETCNGKCPKDSPSNTTNAKGKIVCDYNMECLYDKRHYMCGDICTDYQSTCICGGTNLTYRHTQHYCCIKSDEDCHPGNQVTECRTGKVLHRSEPCYGVCNENSGEKKEGEICEYTDECDYEGYYMCGDLCTQTPATAVAAP